MSAGSVTRSVLRSTFIGPRYSLAMRARRDQLNSKTPAGWSLQSHQFDAARGNSLHLQRRPIVAERFGAFAPPLPVAAILQHRHEQSTDHRPRLEAGFFAADGVVPVGERHAIAGLVCEVENRIDKLFKRRAISGQRRGPK